MMHAGTTALALEDPGMVTTANLRARGPHRWRALASEQAVHQLFTHLKQLCVEHYTLGFKLLLCPALHQQQLSVAPPPAADGGAPLASLVFGVPRVQRSEALGRSPRSATACVVGTVDAAELPRRGAALETCSSRR
eukprot:scaffold111496_cov27-Tisochrysis_lutea.AAC.1